MLFIFGKKGKPLNSVGAILKTSPETAVDRLAWKFGAYIKIRKKWTFKNNSKSLKVSRL